ncbi:BMS1-like ribosome biogenesis protein [Reticulomyxa filosa]|uniref:BMS1-like ribosome biogenesis protein n=1 Tax=Reticulomyxa filosa TaxID=46433 RepID=X6NHW9_RETFI|nr:BMS1-like ribosome biogenesis protein [Reticulomyxa filosa]|eukprot:ETO25329.1 BMS1-like ribosome biogenesis protein [Reticulomyxa filosa]
MTLFEWVYGEGEKEEKNNKNKMNDENNDVKDDESDNDNDSSDEEFFRVKKRTFKRVTESIRNRFVTGDWVAAKKFQSEVEKRAQNRNPDLFDPIVQQDRQIIEDLGGVTMDNPENEVKEDELDWEYRLEQMMKEQGITNSDDITIEDKIKFAQSNNAKRKRQKYGNEDNHDHDDDNDNDNDNEDDKEKAFQNQSKIKKKRNSIACTMLDYSIKSQQRKIFEKKGSENNVKKDRQGKKRGQGGLGEDEMDRKNLAGSGRGEYWMDMQRSEMEKQIQINAQEFANEPESLQHEFRGYIPGTYVRIILENVPSELDMNFDLRFPVILGGLLPQEMEFGFVQCRIKKHRWYKRLLKFNDPLVVSLGWRRFQTVPLFCVEDRNQKRLRLVKYTPEHMHCLTIFYGPIAQPGFGFIGYVDCSPNSVAFIFMFFIIYLFQEFRIAASGTVLSCNTSYKIVKKLKIIGEPYEIHRNTCFVKGMFNSNLEVAKFVGAKIQTVSGVRGSIKKAEGKVGNFRATFEDRLLKSDMIFLKSWVPIAPQQFYNPVRSLLLTFKDQWKGMKTIGQLRAENNARPAFKEDSVYRSHGRKKLRLFNTLKIPTSIQKQLPFNMRQKFRDPKSSERIPMQYPDKETKEAQKLVHSLSEIVANRSEQRSKKKEEDEKARKRRRVQIRERLRGHKKSNAFEATRGDQFHKEWRLQKK